jgi:hypothetical protein
MAAVHTILLIFCCCADADISSFLIAGLLSSHCTSLCRSASLFVVVLMKAQRSRRDRSEPKMHALCKKNRQTLRFADPQHQTDQGFRARTPSMQHQKHAASSLLAPSSSSSLQLVRCFSFYVHTSIPSFPYSRLYSNSRQMMMRSRCGKARVFC